MQRARHDDRPMVARLWYGLCVGLCVFDLDHTLIRTPLDLAAMAAEHAGAHRGRDGPPAVPARAGTAWAS